MLPARKEKVKEEKQEIRLDYCARGRSLENEKHSSEAGPRRGCGWEGGGWGGGEDVDLNVIKGESRWSRGWISGLEGLRVSEMSSRHPRQCRIT